MAQVITGTSLNSVPSESCITRDLQSSCDLRELFDPSMSEMIRPCGQLFDEEPEEITEQENSQPTNNKRKRNSSMSKMLSRSSVGKFASKFGVKSTSTPVVQPSAPKTPVANPVIRAKVRVHRPEGLKGPLTRSASAFLEKEKSSAKATAAASVLFETEEDDQLRRKRRRNNSKSNPNPGLLNSLKERSKRHIPSVTEVFGEVEQIKPVAAAPIETKPKPGNVLGRPLHELMDDQKNTSLLEIPILVQKCIDFILERGVMREGIFRLSCSHSLLKAVVEQIQDGNDFGTKALEDQEDPHLFACLLKKFLRDLPNPLLESDRMNDWMAAVEAANQEMESQLLEGESKTVQPRLSADSPAMGILKAVIAELPKSNQALLKILIQFCAVLDNHSEKTKMASSNLAVVFGPNLLWAEDPRNDNVSGVNQLIELIINNSEALFGKYQANTGMDGLLDFQAPNHEASNPMEEY